MIIQDKTLVGYQLAEFSRASHLRNWLLVFQLLLAVPPAASVFTDDHVTLYYLAIAGAVLLLIWVFLDLRYYNRREIGEALRRTTLIRLGLGLPLSPEEEFRLQARFTVDEAEASKKASSDYYASPSPRGLGRLCEMIEESAFWTERMQRDSAVFMSFVFAAMLIIFAAAFWLTLPMSTRETQLLIARLFLTLLVFLLSSDIWGAVSGHIRAWLVVKEMRQRAVTVAAKGYPQGDVLLLMADYNAAVEAAPMSVPLVYELRKEYLNKLWRSYQASRQRGDRMVS